MFTVAKPRPANTWPLIKKEGGKGRRVRGREGRKRGREGRKKGGLSNPCFAKRWEMWREIPQTLTGKLDSMAQCLDVRLGQAGRLDHRISVYVIWETIP